MRQIDIEGYSADEQVDEISSSHQERPACCADFKINPPPKRRNETFFPFFTLPTNCRLEDFTLFSTDSLGSYQDSCPLQTYARGLLLLP